MQLWIDTSLKIYGQKKFEVVGMRICNWRATFFFKDVDLKLRNAEKIAVADMQLRSNIS
jgi:hypothetical protein